MLMSARMFEANDTIMERDALPGDAAISGTRLTEHCHERGAGTLGSLNGKGVWMLTVSGCYSGRLHEPRVAAAEEAQSWCAEEDATPASAGGRKNKELCQENTEEEIFQMFIFGLWLSFCHALPGEVVCATPRLLLSPMRRRCRYVPEAGSLDFTLARDSLSVRRFSR
jgi:hypothetical protein